MRTLKYRNTYDSDALLSSVMRFTATNVERYQYTWYTTDTVNGGTITLYYVFVDDGGEENRAQLTTSTATTLPQTGAVFGPGSGIYEIDFKPVGSSGTVRIDVNTIRSK